MENIPEEHNFNDSKSEPDKLHPNELNTVPKKLYRSRTDRIFFGICGGLGIFFDVNPIIFRLLFIISLLFGAWGIVIYLILSIVILNSPFIGYQNYYQPNFIDMKKSKTIFGSFLILLGIYLMMIDIGLSKYLNFFGIRYQLIIPTILMIACITFVLQYDFNFQEIYKPVKIYRKGNNKIIAGVCSSLAEYFSVEPFFIRSAFILFSILTIVIPIIIYLVFIISLPIKKDGDFAGKI